MDAPPRIFDAAARRRRRDRATTDFAEYDFVHAAMLDGVAERLEAVTRSFADVLLLGCHGGVFPTLAHARVLHADPGFRWAAEMHGVQVQETALPFADEVFDLVIAVGTLDTVDDLPGALTLIRRILRPDGLFLGAFLGGGTLGALRRATRVAEGDRPTPRVHPMVDVRAGGDLLMRAGFALPVADVETLSVRYAGVARLLEDVRGMGASSVLTERRPLRRDTLAGVAAAFDAQAVDGRTTERFDIIHLTGWAPAHDQPKPARRGSATRSLADALRPHRGN